MVIATVNVALSVSSIKEDAVGVALIVIYIEFTNKTKVSSGHCY